MKSINLVKLLLITALFFSTIPVDETMAGPFRGMGARNISKAIRMNTRQIFKPTFRVQSRYSDGMTTADISDDGKWLTTGGKNRSLQLWNLTNGQRVLNMDGHSGTVTSAKFLPINGELYGYKSRPQTRDAASRSGFLVSGDSKGRARLWSLVDGKMVRIFKGHSKRITTVTATPEGKYMITGSSDGTIRMWDLTSGKQTKLFTGHNGKVADVAISFDSKFIASGGSDGSVKIWDIASAKLLEELDERDGPITSLDWDRSGVRIVSGHDNGRIRVWDLKKIFSVRSLGQNKHKKTRYNSRSLSGHGNGTVHDVVFSPNGERIASVGNDKKVRIWSSSNGKQIYDLTGHQQNIVSATFFPNGRFLATASDDHTVRIWNDDSRTEVARLVTMRSGWAVVTPDGRFDGTLDGDLEDRLDAIQWAGDGNIFSIDGFMEHYYRPALLGKLLSQDSGTVKGAARVKSAPNITEGFYLPPKVNILYDDKKSTKKKRVKVIVKAEDMGDGIDEIRLYHNNKIIDPGKGEDVGTEKGKNGTIKKTHYRVELVNGENVFKAVGLSKSRIEGQATRMELFYKPADAPREPSLHVFVVGINEYGISDLNLNYAIPDAKGVMEFFMKSQGGLFKNVVTYEIYNDKATGRTINRELTALHDIPPEDTVILYFAGHGETIDDSWFFIPHELKAVNKRSIIKQGVPASRFRKHLSSIGAHQIVLLFDACKSGAAVKAFSEFTNLRSMAMLSRATGTHIATSTTDTQLATELDSLGHGVFTYAMLQGWKGKADRNPRDQQISISESFGFLKKYMPFLSFKYDTGTQTPVINSQGPDFLVSRN
ncbi:MAG: caspase family protein [Magnetococcales bacterium]|nr:caspase family protein [Magnetococcales bacterium]